jgi:D-amino-acid dehydrogenase
MHIIVLGGGVIGVTTAYYLAGDGHDVTVIEQLSDVGQDATGGNAGLIAPGHSFAWASSAAPGMLLRSLRGEKTAIRVRPRLDIPMMVWGVQFLRECTAKRAVRNTIIKLGLCQYSQARLAEIVEAEKLEFQHVPTGALYLYRSQEALDKGAKKTELLQRHGQTQRIVSPDEVVALDKALAPIHDKIAGAIYSEDDASGNSELFTQALAERCRAKGVKFLTNTTVRRLTAKGDRVVSATTDRGVLTADAYVLALGVHSPKISSTVGQHLPVYPAKGFSLTAPMLDPADAPTIAGVDEKTLVAWSRMGDQVRVSSTAQFCGYSRTWTREDFGNILQTAGELFPKAADWERAKMRSCLRPMTPDGPPIMGRGRHTNLFYNTGHGHMGWTMSWGCGRIVADMIDGKTPAIDLGGFEVRGYRMSNTGTPATS